MASFNCAQADLFTTVRSASRADRFTAPLRAAYTTFSGDALRRRGGGGARGCGEGGGELNHRLVRGPGYISPQFYRLTTLSLTLVYSRGGF